MYRIGILGTENSHAMAFSRMFNGKEPGYLGEFDDMRVVCAFGTDNAANEALRNQADVPVIVDKPEDMLGSVDAVMVTARDGQFHAEYALPFIKAGLPAFIDKPFTRDSGEALSLVRLAKERNVPLCGGSSLKCCAETKLLAKYVREKHDKVLSGSVYAPVNMKNDYGDFWFYSSHLAEICLSVFGYDPRWVCADERTNGVIALVHYDSYSVTNHYSEAMYQYGGCVVSQEGIHAQTISLDDAYGEECRTFARMLRTGRMVESYEHLIVPVFFLEATLRAMKNGTREEVCCFNL